MTERSATCCWRVAMISFCRADSAVMTEIFSFIAVALALCAWWIDVIVVLILPRLSSSSSMALLPW